MKTKKKFINIQPKSSKAKNRFVNQMSSLHAMEVEQETDDKFFLASINRQYFTWIPKAGNEHWDIIKQNRMGEVMVVILSTIITCSQAFSLVNRISNVVGLTSQQKIEVVNEIRKVIPSCPVTIQKDVPKSSPTGN